MDTKDLENRFKFHPAKDEIIKLNHQEIRTSCLHLSQVIDKLVPEGREKALAITKLEEVMMWANAGIARNND